MGALAAIAASGIVGPAVEDAEARPWCGDHECPSTTAAQRRQKPKPKPQAARPAPKPKATPAPAPRKPKPRSTSRPQRSSPASRPRTPDAAEAWAEHEHSRRREANARPKPAKRTPKPAPAPPAAVPAPPPALRTPDASADRAARERTQRRMAKHRGPAQRAPQRKARSSQRTPKPEPATVMPHGLRTPDAVEGWARDAGRGRPSTSTHAASRVRTVGGDDNPWADLFRPTLTAPARIAPILPPPRLVRGVPDQDPVRWDRACTTGLIPGCDPGAASRRLREDRLHFGLGGLLLPHPQPWRASSEGFRESEREWLAARRRRDAAAADRGPLAQVTGVFKGVADWGSGMKDSLVRGYESTSLITCSPAAGGCDIHPLAGVSREEHARASRENAEAAAYAIEHPDEAGKALVNWEDLSEGRYGEWLGTIGPDLAIGLATGGGGTLTKIARTPRALDVPSPPRQRRIDGSPESRAVIDELFGHTSSLRTSPRRGQAVPTRVRGAASELRALYDWSSRPYVRRITPIGHRSGSRSPDFVVTLRDGRRVRVEVTTVSEGAGSGYRPRGFGRSGPVSRARIAGAIDRKVKPRRTQFNAELGDVPEGGILSLHLRGPATPAAAAADEAITARREMLDAAGVRTVEVNLTDRRVVRYTLTRPGEWRRRVLPRI